MVKRNFVTGLKIVGVMFAQWLAVVTGQVEPRADVLRQLHNR